MKYKYSIKIHNVVDYSELENVMNDYGSNGYRIVTAEFVNDVFESGRSIKKFVVYLEKKINK